MGAKLFLTDAIVISKGDEPAVKIKTSEKTGEKTASFSVGVKKYDPAYANNVRYNNYFIFVPTNMVETVTRMKLQRKSMVHIVADHDYTKDILAAKVQQGDVNAADYGKSRMVNGVICRLIDIEYAGTASTTRGTASTNAENTKGEPKSSTPVGASSSNGTNANPTSAQNSPAPPSHSMALTEDGERGKLEKELGIGIVDLEEEDIFRKASQNRERRKFF